MTDRLRNLTPERLERAMDEAMAVVMARNERERMQVSHMPESASVAAYRRCAEEGLTVKQTAEKLGVSPASVYQMAKARSLKFRSGRGKARYDD